MLGIFKRDLCVPMTPVSRYRRGVLREEASERARKIYASLHIVRTVYDRAFLAPPNMRKMVVAIFAACLFTSGDIARIN